MNKLMFIFMFCALAGVAEASEAFQCDDKQGQSLLSNCRAQASERCAKETGITISERNKCVITLMQQCLRECSHASND